MNQTLPVQTTNARIWDATNYTKKHSFVASYGLSLIELLAPENGEKILDLGCGTGELTFEIHQKGAEVTGIDSSETMLKNAQERFPGISFHAISAEEYRNEGFYDAIFSNAALHWILNQEIALQRCFNNLKPGGRLVLEMGGKNNIAGILNALLETLKEEGYQDQTKREQWYFPSPAAYTSLLESCGFEVNALWYYDRPTPLLDPVTGVQDWLMMFGKTYLDGVDNALRIVQKAQERIRDTHFDGNKWIADYKRLRVAATKPLNYNTK